MKSSRKKQKKDDHILDNVVIDHSLQSTNVKSIIKAMSTSSGFQSTNLSFGVEILRRMQSEKRCTKFLSFVGALLFTGVRGIIRDVIQAHLFARLTITSA